MRHLKSIFLCLFFSLLLVSCKDENPVSDVDIFDVESLKANYNNSWDGFCLSEGDSLSVLAIGNSFAVDAVRYYLHPLFAAVGIKIKIGCLYIPSCTLMMHLNNLTNNSHDYSYCYIDYDGTRTDTEKQSLVEILRSKEWDVITVQQVSEYSGFYDTYQTTLPKLLSMLRKRARAETKLALHQTWAYSQDCSRDKFSFYGHNQLMMYDAIVYSTLRAMVSNDIDFIIPVGTAIQQARTTALGDNMTRDGFHLSLTLGCYIASSTWYEAISGLDIRSNPYRAADITEDEKSLVSESVHWAVKHPFDLKD